MCKKYFYYNLILFYLSFLNTSFGLHEFEVFDGRTYNGKFYPRIDIIEWQEEHESSSHIELQNYHYKDHPVEYAFKIDNQNQNTVVLIEYFLPKRNERLCRKIIAPLHFKKDQKLLIYQKTESDRQITYVTNHALPNEKDRKQIENIKPYTNCEAIANEMKTKGKGEDENTQKRYLPDDSGLIKKEDGSMPFDF
jgi:hypothetical protein